MSPGIRLAADASSFISPRRPPGHAGLGSQACPKADSVFRLWVAAQAETPGAGALGCAIKEETSATGRRRGTFAPKDTRNRSPYISRSEAPSVGKEGLSTCYYRVSPI